jgi:hypothetical protein
MRARVLPSGNLDPLPTGSFRIERPGPRSQQGQRDTDIPEKNPVPPIPMMEEAVQKRIERNEYCGNSRPEPHEQQNAAAGASCVQENLGGRATLPDDHHCVGQQIEADNDSREQKPNARSTPRKAVKESLHAS